MKVIIGLGNPGSQYENTRHNVGFLALDFVQKNLHFPDWEDSKFHGILSKVSPEISLLKPMTFMNLSGNSVASMVNFYKLDPKNDILVISDDIDMEFAKIRFRSGGSHGGQNGLRDIIEKLGTNEFARLKIGIGRHEQYSVSDWVLSKFTKDELAKLEEVVFPSVMKRVEEWLIG